MRILFFGDSITDAGRVKENALAHTALGFGYVRSIAERLIGLEPHKHEIVNTGISGHRVVDLYARVKKDCWNYNPDVVSILVGINDLWHEISSQNGVDPERFEKVYRMLIEDTKKALPDVKIILCEPFVIKGHKTEPTDEMPDRFEIFKGVYEYASIVKKLAEDYSLPFVALQEKLTEASERLGPSYICHDGIHPVLGGATIIAEEWLKVFKAESEK